MKLNTLPLLIDFLRHIQRELAFVIEAAEGQTVDSLLADPRLSRAVTHSLLIIGEACKKVPDEFRHKHPEFNWRGFAGLRDRLIHHY